MLPSARLRLLIPSPSPLGLGGITKILTRSGIWPRTLAAPDIDVQQQIFSVFRCVGQVWARCAIEVAEDIPTQTRWPSAFAQGRAIDVWYSRPSCSEPRGHAGVADGKIGPLTSTAAD